MKVLDEEFTHVEYAVHCKQSDIALSVATHLEGFFNLDILWRECHIERYTAVYMCSSYRTVIKIHVLIIVIIELYNNLLIDI